MSFLESLPPLTWVIAVCAAAVGWGLAWLAGWYRRRRARKALIAAVTAGALEFLSDVLVPDGMGGSYHVDFLLLTTRGAVVVDLRNAIGNVFGGDQMDEWTVMDGARRSTFVNPQAALYDRVAAVKALVADMPVEGRIVFTRRARFPKGLPQWTVMLDALATEFPPAEPSQAASMTERYGGDWSQITSAATPSSLAQSRGIAMP